MNKTKQIFINCIAIATLLLATSCEKELYDEAIKTNTSTEKSKPNIKVSSLNFTRNHPTIQKISQKTKSKLKTSRTNSIETNTLEAYFGEVKLDYGVEIIDSLNRKTTTFEVKETTVNPNEYYNFVIQNDSEFWLYKIEKIESTYKNYPANSTIVSRYSINDNLTMSSPCDTIVFPPFGEMISEVIPSGTGGGSVSIGNINNPTEGGGFGFGLGVGYGSGYFNGLGPGSGGSGGGPSSGGNGASGQSLALIQIEDFLSDAWNWIRNLFSGGCKCGNRTSNRGAEEDLIVNSGGVVLEIKDSTVDCGEGGYVFITPQDEYVDKILEFENYFTYLHNNDRVFLYNNHHIVDYLYTLIQQNSNNANLMTILPELINKTRKGEITWEFAQSLIEGLINNPQPSYTSSDYPGKNDGMPYEWWKDNNYMLSHFEILEEDPNPAELLAFSIFPDKALLHIQNSITALNKTEQLVTNNTLTGIEDGRADAFRHAYWNALGTAEFGANITQIFTDAHEAYSSGLPKQMDLHNNQKGREKAISMSFNFLTSDSDIADSILIEVYVGHLLFIHNGVLTPTY